MQEIPAKDDEVPVAFVKKLLDFTESLGYQIEPYLETAHISRAFLGDKNNHIANQLQMDIVEQVVHDVDTPGFGLLLGRQISVLDWGILGYAFISSANMRKAFDTFSTYQRLNGPMVNVYVRQEEGDGIIAAAEAIPLAQLYQFAIEEWLAESRGFFERFDVAAVKFTQVLITYPEPEHAQMYRDLFDCRVHFDQPANEIHFPAEFLDVPFNMADEVVAELCIRQCAEVLKHLSDEDPVVDAVRRVLLSRPGITPTLEVIAGYLHMSARTLRRRLHEAGTSYKDVLSDVRLGLAAEYLRSTRMAPKEIAYLLGYSGVTSFHRAFKNRFAMTPADFRNEGQKG